jgi:hypothetical protein
MDESTPLDLTNEPYDQVLMTETYRKHNHRLDLILNLFVALIVLMSTVLILMLIYFIIRVVAYREKNNRCRQAEQVPALLDIEAGRESRLSHRLSREQIQQKHYESLQKHYLSVPSSPIIELLPEINTSSSDDRANEWLERGVVGEGVNVLHGDLGQKKPEMQQAIVVKPKKQLGWDCRDGRTDHSGRSSMVVEKTNKDGVVCAPNQAG